MSQMRLYLSARKPEANGLARVLDPIFEDEGLPAVLFEDEDSPGQWTWSVYCDADDADRVEGLIVDRLGSDAFALPVKREVLPDVDWVAETLRDLTPVRAGRFFVHGTHDNDRAAKERWPIRIDAGLAFGTGHHGTTAGCLDLLEIVLRKRSLRNALDVGTGSGVLAIALAKAARIPILATDIDAVAVRVAAENARLNGVSPFVQTATAAGFQHPAFAAFGPADLIFANILAGPLQKLANPMFPWVAPGGHIILSGLLPHQQARIVATYRGQGFVFEKAHIREGWLSLLMHRP